MDSNNPYYRQVQFLIQLLPLVGEEACFALKGGTAINLFVRDLPRLSVDIDLVYLPTHDRAQALEQIKTALTRIAQRIQSVFPSAHIAETFLDKSDALRLIIAHRGVQIKIELSPVLRGTVYEPEIRSVTSNVEAQFGYADMAVVSLADLYAGKLCAALDRQHPRDLYDVKLLLENEGITEEIRKAFLVYLISHPRPIAEILNPTLKEMQSVYEGEFVAMTQQPVALGALIEARKNMIELVNHTITESEKLFLISFKNKVPDWSLLGLNGVSELPAVRWKLMNLHKMPTDKHQQALQQLTAVLALK